MAWIKPVALLFVTSLSMVVSIPNKIFEVVATEAGPNYCSKLDSDGKCYQCPSGSAADCVAMTGNQEAQCWSCPDGTAWIGGEQKTCSDCKAPPKLECDIPKGRSTGKQADDLPEDNKWPADKKVAIYWMPPYNKPDYAIPPADVVKRATNIVLAFSATYHMKKPSYTEPDCHSECTLDTGFPVDDPNTLTKYVNEIKKINPNVKVSVSFGGWNQGPGDQGTNCYQQSKCYGSEGVAKLAKELAELPCIDGIDIDYEMTTDLTLDPAGEGIPFLQDLTKALKANEVLEVTQAPMPPYMSGGQSSKYPEACESYSKGVLSDPAVRADIDALLIQYYNNPGYTVGEDSDNIVEQIKATGVLMGDASKAVAGLCFVDCNEGYSAPTYDEDTHELSKDQEKTKTLLQKLATAVPRYGGVMLWTNPISTKDAINCYGCQNGGVADIATYLDLINPK